MSNSESKTVPPPVIQTRRPVLTLRKNDAIPVLDLGLKGYQVGEGTFAGAGSIIETELLIQVTADDKLRFRKRLENWPATLTTSLNTIRREGSTTIDIDGTGNEAQSVYKPKPGQCTLGVVVSEVSCPPASFQATLSVDTIRSVLRILNSLNSLRSPS